LKHLFCSAALLLLALFSAAPSFAQNAAPAVVSSSGYLNETPLTAHTTGAFNSVGATTMVAFVGSHPVWNGVPVTISGLSDNLGNTWNVLTGPTIWAGTSATLLGAMYYVNVPTTSATHIVTVQLTNAAPLVIHVFAVSGSDVTGPPIYSPITDPGDGVTSATVTTAPITVTANSLLLSWAKNEAAATATAVGGYTLDGQSVPFLWGESQTALAAGSYTGQFQYDTAIGWQTAIVGLKASSGPAAFNQSVSTSYNTPIAITLTAVSPSHLPLTYTVTTGPASGVLSGLAPNLSYTPNAGFTGTDSFTFKANDGTTDSNMATVSIIVLPPYQPPAASNSNVTVATGSTTAITLNASDAENYPLTYTIVAPPANGQLSGTGSSRTYTPNAGYLGSDSFTFKVNDGIADSNVATVSITVVSAPQAPTVVNGSGYINGTAMTTHTTAAFNSVGASTLLAFVSTNTPWNGQPVTISGVNDNVGNTWNVLTGPTTFAGSTNTLLSAIYYVNAPATSATHTVTVLLTNAAPLVVHVFAVSGSDVTGPPIYSPITDPGTGATSANVTTASITVPVSSLLLSWVKNESSGTATALGGYTLDGQSTSFLWAESLTGTAGAYTGQFQYDTAIGWQTAIVGLKASSGPAAFNQSVTANYNTPIGIALTAASPGNLPLTYTVTSGPASGVLSGLAPNLTYTPNAGFTGADSFTFKANDGTTDSNIASISIIVLPPYQPPVASNSNVTVAAGSAIAITLNASDAENYPLTYTIVTPPANGQLSGISSSRTYTPNAGYLGSDSFTFKVNDGVSDSNVATVSIIVVSASQAPAVVSSSGYINGTAMTTHTTAAFNSVGASTLLAFVSTNTPWNGQPVSISGVSDNVGNTWNVLTGPTTFAGITNTLLSAIYYINVPAASATHTVTVQLTNGAPMVVHVFAVSGSDVTGPPIYSPITDPGAGTTSASVTTASITVPASSLLLSWVKNESSSTATALGGYTLDSQSTSFLWAESLTGVTSGAYTGQFLYAAPIGWQTAIVGLKPPDRAPVASDGSVATNQGAPVSGTLVATDADGNALTFAIVSNGTMGTATVTDSATGTYTYTPNPNAIGTDTFTFKANDGTLDSNVATVTITIAPTTPPPTPAITSGPASPTNQTSASFTFSDTQAGVSFVCQLDSSGFSTCISPEAYPGPLAQGSHSFTVKAQDTAGNQSATATLAWTINTTPPPTPAIISMPANPTNQTTASFTFNDSQAGVSFLCQLDSGVFNACSSPAAYSGPLTQGSHTFSVKAQDAAGNQSGAATFTWTVNPAPPPAPAITSMPANPTNETNAIFTFSDTEGGLTFFCQLDGGTYTGCSSPLTYSGPLTQGKHTFAVLTRDAAHDVSSATKFTWTIDTTAPPTPTITSQPANPTNRTNATFRFTDAQKGVSFLCQFDGSVFSPCVSPITYPGPLAQGSHMFSVEAEDSAGNQSVAASFTWNVDTTAPPTPVITSKPASQTNETTGSFSFTDTEAGVQFSCRLDVGTFAACSSPVTYPGPLAQGTHTFWVLARDTAGNLSNSAKFSWTIDTTPPPTPIITSKPANPTNQTGATFSFSDTQSGVRFSCRLDGGAFTGCSSPVTYPGPLTQGVHGFWVLAGDAAGNLSSPARFNWTITP
jgi:hypothetical protein